MSAQSIYRNITFFYVQRVKGFDVPTSPCFDTEEATKWFRDRLGEANNYLEYGSGGSTYMAAQLGKTFVSVDSDRFFLDAVRKRIAQDGHLDSQSQAYEYADVGLTRVWGTPVVIGKPSKGRLSSFARYSDFRQVAGALPDLVLVDGRFRVACALKTLQALRDRSDWTLVVDDYVSRPDYAVLEKYGKLDRMIGGMAIFTEAMPLSASEFEQAIGIYEHQTH